MKYYIINYLIVTTRSSNNRRFLLSPKILVIGLDGASFNFLDPLLHSGKLPNLANILSLGRGYYLESTVPANTPVAWTSMTTGKNPGKHNIYGFVDREPQTMQLRIPMGSDMRSKTLWEHLSDNKKSVVVLNVPETYPPRAVNGLLVSGFLASDIDKACYPKSLAEELKELGCLFRILIL